MRHPPPGSDSSSGPPPRLCGRRLPQVAGDVDAQYVCAETILRKSGRAVATAYVEHLHARRHAKAGNQSLAAAADRIGDPAEVGFLPQCLVRAGFSVTIVSLACSPDPVGRRHCTKGAAFRHPPNLPYFRPAIAVVFCLALPGCQTAVDGPTNRRPLYDADGQPLGEMTIHAGYNIVYTDKNNNSQPDPAEITVEHESFNLRCR